MVILTIWEMRSGSLGNPDHRGETRRYKCRKMSRLSAKAKFLELGILYLRVYDDDYFYDALLLYYIMISVGNTGLQLAENCLDHPGIRIAERQINSVSETRQVRFEVTRNVTVYWG